MTSHTLAHGGDGLCIRGLSHFFFPYELIYRLTMNKYSKNRNADSELTHLE